MANFVIGTGDYIVMPKGDHFSVGSLENHGSASGEGTIGLNWASPIEGNAESVTCPIVEENIPDWSVTPFMGEDYIWIEYTENGARLYSASMDGNSALINLPGESVFLFEGLERKSAHRFNLAATNSREHSILREYNITLFAAPTMYRVITQTFEQADRNREQNSAFLARITDVITGAPLVTSDVESIRLNGFRLIKNVSGIGRVVVNGFEDISVDASAVYSAFVRNDFWTRDSGGYNFFHAPDQVAQYLLPVPGSYQVEYEIRLKEGNPISICYDVFVN